MVKVRVGQYNRIKSTTTKLAQLFRNTCPSQWRATINQNTRRPFLNKSGVSLADIKKNYPLRNRRPASRRRARPNCQQTEACPKERPCEPVSKGEIAQCKKLLASSH